MNQSHTWITYLPDPEDPPSVRWQGYVFHANKPKRVTKSTLIEKAKANSFFRVNDSVHQSIVAAAAPELKKQHRRRRTPRLAFCEIEAIADDISRALERSMLTENEKKQLLRAVNEALDQYAIDNRHEKLPTLNQFEESFLQVRDQLKRLKRVLPSRRGHDRDHQLFEAICRHGEAYAKKHGPHLGLDPIQLPPMLGLDEQERNFRSSQRLRELIEAVEEVVLWLDDYDQYLVPNIGWKRLEAYWKRQVRGGKKGEGLRKARVRLIGHALPEIYKKHFGQLPSSASSSGKNRDGRVYRPWVKFVCEVYGTAFDLTAKQNRLSPATVEEYWKRMREAGLKTELPIGPQWRTNP